MLSLFELRMGKSNAGKYGLQQTVMGGFLDYVESRYRLESRSGHGRKEKTLLLVLSSDTMKLFFYNDYMYVYMDKMTTVS